MHNLTHAIKLLSDSGEKLVVQCYGDWHDINFLNIKPWKLHYFSRWFRDAPLWSKITCTGCRSGNSLLQSLCNRTAYSCLYNFNTWHDWYTFWGRNWVVIGKCSLRSVCLTRMVFLLKKEEKFEDVLNMKYITKYGNTLYVWIGQVKNGRLYLRYGSSSEKVTANWAKALTDKKHLL